MTLKVDKGLSEVLKTAWYSNKQYFLLVTGSETVTLTSHSTSSSFFPIHSLSPDISRVEMVTGDENIIDSSEVCAFSQQKGYKRRVVGCPHNWFLSTFSAVFLAQIYGWKNSREVTPEPR